MLLRKTEEQRSLVDEDCLGRSDERDLYMLTMAVSEREVIVCDWK